MSTLNLPAARRDVAEFVASREGKPVYAKTIHRRLFSASPVSLRAVSAEIGFSAVYIGKVEKQLREQLLSPEYPDLYEAMKMIGRDIVLPCPVQELDPDFLTRVPGLDINLIDVFTRLNRDLTTANTSTGQWLILTEHTPAELKRNIQLESRDGITVLRSFAHVTDNFLRYVGSNGWFFLDRHRVISHLTPVGDVIKALLAWHGELDTDDIVEKTMQARSLMGRDVTEHRIKILLRDDPAFTRIRKHGWALTEPGQERHVDALSTMSKLVERANGAGVEMDVLEEAFEDLGYSAQTAHAYAARPEFRRERGRVYAA